MFPRVAALLAAALGLLLALDGAGLSLEPPLLGPGTPLERPLEAGGSDELRFERRAGEHQLLVIEQLGIDLVVEVRGPTGEETLRVDSPLGREGAEILLLDAEPGGTYLAEIRSAEKAAPPGRYVARLEVLPADTVPQRQRLRAEAALTTAGRLWATDAKTAREQALPHLRAALEDWRRLVDRRREAQTLDWLGSLLEHGQDFRGAAATFEEALARWRQLEDPAGLAATLDHLGFTQHQLGESSRAVLLLEEALALRQRLGQDEREAQSRGLLGLALQRSGRWTEAERHYQAALSLCRKLGDRKLEALLLNNLGGLASNRGEPEEELGYLQQALALRRAHGDRLDEAITLNNLGAFHRGLGEVEEALVAYSSALEIFEQQGERYWQARTLNNTGYAYLTLGEPERARALLLRALELRREVGDRQGEATTLRNLARATAELGERSEALSFARRALDSSLAVSDRRGATSARKLLGELRLAERQPSEARSELDAALASLRELGSRPEEAEVLGLLGEVELAMGGAPKAVALATEALGLHRRVRNPLGEVTALATLAGAERALGRPLAAAERLATALGLLGSLQGRLGDPDRRAAFRATQRHVHELEVDLLMDQHRRQPGAGHDRRALEASERARSQVLLAVLEDAGAGLGGDIEPELAGRLRRAERLFAAKTQRLPRLLGAEPTPELARQAEQELLTALTGLDSLRAQIRRRDSGYGLRSRPPSLDAQGIRQQLDHDTVLLEIFLGERASVLWWVTLREVSAFELPPRQALEELAARLHRQLGAVHQRDGQLSPLLAAVGQALLGPISDRLRGQRLVVVADGALALLPFAALTSPATGEPLLAHHELVSVPSASVLAAQRRVPSATAKSKTSGGAKVMAIFADPVFASRDRLAYTRLEAEAIAALLPPEQRRLVMAAEARRSRVLAGELAHDRILHFATHGLIHPRIPELSGLLLSERDDAGRTIDGFLSLRDLSSLELSAELVVLSGCETGLGREVRGEGLLGLTRGLMMAGVPRVLASLWQVRDQATAELMARFYRALLTERQPPAAALRSAQLALRGERRFRDPYYWAAFVLHGDWRPLELPAAAH